MHGTPEPRMSVSGRCRRRGFTLPEVVASLFVVSIMAGFLVPLASSLMDANRGIQTQAELARMYAAVVGSPNQRTHGYLGDVGVFPASLMDLVEKPVSNPSGWNGPYLTDVRIVNGSLYDAYGSPIECYHLRDSSTSDPAKADRFALISRGPDRTSTNTSATPNTCSTFTGTLPSGAYAAGAGNADNVVYPRFTDNGGLLDYQHVGRLSISILNFDQNANINSMVPGCPHLYTITVTSVTRGSNDTFSMPFSPGANSMDLPQGVYTVRVTSPAALGALWEERVAIGPGTTVARRIKLAGLDSSVTPNQVFQPVNLYGSTIWAGQSATPADLGTVTSPGVGPGTGNWAQVKPCGRITIRLSTSSGLVVESFTYPYFQPAVSYLRRINTNALFDLTVVNQNSQNTAARRQLFVFDTGVLVGVVTSDGAFKAKTIPNFKFGNPYTVVDKLGNQLASGSMPSANLTINLNN